MRPRTDCCELSPDMENHDDGHDEGGNVHGAGPGFEDDGVGQLDIPGVAIRLDAQARSLCAMADGGT